MKGLMEYARAAYWSLRAALTPAAVVEARRRAFRDRKAEVERAARRTL